jgi:peptidoglycan/LPS O-acetylase OafA/YrhL
MPRMDGLRAICVMLVLTEHFFRGVGQGGIGVAIFFVISGYLITSILVTYSEQLPLWDAARRFYWRRALRLFPAFYLCIALAALLDLGGMRDNWWVNALYLMNFKVAADGAWNGSSHFWTLCVEEQFYPIWFFVVELTPRKYFLHVVLACLITAPLYRAVMYLEGFTSFMSPLFRQTGWEWATVHYRLGPDFLRFIVLATAAIAVAEVSWRFVEKPIMRLKDFSRARLVRV